MTNAQSDGGEVKENLRRFLAPLILPLKSGWLDRKDPFIAHTLNRFCSEFLLPHPHKYVLNCNRMVGFYFGEPGDRIHVEQIFNED